MPNHKQNAIDDAMSSVEDHIKEIAEYILDFSSVPTDAEGDLDGFEQYHHENHLGDYGLLEAAEVLTELSEHEETDSGFWEGKSPKEALSTMAAYTYSAAVLHQTNAILKDLKDFQEIEDLIEEMDESEDFDRDAMRRNIRDAIQKFLDMNK